MVSNILSLAYVFLACLAVEWLSHARLVKYSSDSYNVKAGLLQTLMYGIRIGLAYFVMLQVMSFNSGILLTAIAGYSVGFSVFGSRIFKRSKIVPDDLDDSPDLPPLNC